jgi:hypothetical protein
MQLSPCWHSRIPFCNLTLQFWIMSVQPQFIHCQSASKECFSIPKNIHSPTSHMWLAGLHSVCMESTLHRPSAFLTVSAECKTCLLWIFPCLLQIAVHVMLLSSSRTAPTCSTSHICHGCRHNTASSISYIFPPPQMAFIHQQTVPYDATWLHSPSCMRSWLPHGDFLSREWKVYTWETSLQAFSVLC